MAAVTADHDSQLNLLVHQLGEWWQDDFALMGQHVGAVLGEHDGLLEEGEARLVDVLLEVQG